MIKLLLPDLSPESSGNIQTGFLHLSVLALSNKRHKITNYNLKQVPKDTATVTSTSLNLKLRHLMLVVLVSNSCNYIQAGDRL